MPRVFEDFVTTGLAEALTPYGGRTRPRETVYLDERQPGWAGVAMRLDLAFDGLDSVPVIFDAKYKAASPSGEYPNADLYQMLAYCTALRAPVAWLIYAKGAGGMVRRRVRHTDIEIVQYPLDLALPPRALLAQVAELARLAVPSRRVSARLLKIG